LENDGSVTVFHLTRGWVSDTVNGVNNYGFSTCQGNNYNFTRIESDIDIMSFMPTGRQLHHNPSLFFKRNNIQYVVGRNITLIVSQIRTNNFISIFQTDGNYRLTSFWGNISSIGGGTNTYNSGFFIDEVNDPDTLHIYYTEGFTQLYHTTWDLRNLD
jgi:hypothetical protein